MAFDPATRNRLAQFVGKARALLSEEFTRQLQLDYGIDPASGEVTPLDRLGRLDDVRRETAQLLRDTLDHYSAASAATGVKARQEVIDRIVREQAFTVLNRLCALRMAEARGIIIEAVAKGEQSRGFQLYARLAGAALGETGDAYRCFVFSVFDELAVDLPVLFDRFSPQGRLFPREEALLPLLALINQPDLDALWAEDETIGWVYQYFNSKDERKAMRDASQAPRNSRELAVRNQFFTPRYVVEFLTDNTLGRTWYEMTQGATALAESCRYLVRRPSEIFLKPGAQAPTQPEPDVELSQEELLKQPVYIPHRPLKDPRGILMLDPACGSMHFGLYAFDLFERMYDEAWELEAERGPQALERPLGVKPLHESYADKEALLRDVPRLIIERNIHGVDIDPRAAQIAGLSLWLRAQKSWLAQGVKPHERPQIRRSNVVVAEPMPGDRTLLDEFIARQLAATPEDRVVADLVREVFAAMTLAGEAGSLLKIEEQIAGGVERARKRYEDAVLQRRKDADYLPGLAPERDTNILDLLDLPRPEQFWGQVEERIYAALRAYAEQSDDGAGYRRRLFADDAARGFAFIDLCRRRYDVVLMNPPFGSPAISSASLIESAYPECRGDVYGAFIMRGFTCLLGKGTLGAITNRTGFFTAGYESWRSRFIYAADSSIRLFLDLGSGILDSALVETAAYCCDRNGRDSADVFSLIGEDNKPNKLKETIRDIVAGELTPVHHLVNFELLGQIPTRPFAYWAPQKIAQLYTIKNKLEPRILEARQGLRTLDDFRFLRLWWEVPGNEKFKETWVYCLKGGPYQKFFAYPHLLCAWQRQGAEIKALVVARYGSVSRIIQAQDYYFRFGLTYTRRTSSRFGVRTAPAGCNFADKGPLIVSPSDSKEDLYFLLGYLNSPLVAYLISLSLAAVEGAARAYEVGIIQRLPWINIDSVERSVIIKHSKDAVQILQHEERTNPTSPDFVLPSSISDGLQAVTDSNKQRQFREFERLKAITSDIDCYICEAAGVEAYSHILAEYRDFNTSSSMQSNIADDDEVPTNGYLANQSSLDFTQSYLEVLLGLVFGRWDIRYATGERTAPEVPDPFAPLPVCPPGMLQNAQGLPAAPAEVPVSYPLRISWPGILVDDEGHAEDIAGRVREAIAVIWGERADAIEQEACEILGVRSLRDYFRKPASFFADHLGRYSKSRRQAPIYWPLSTASGGYTLWLYYHRLSDQTLYSCVNDFVDPKLALISEQAAGLRRRAGRTAKEERELEGLSDMERELAEFRAELLRVAAFWKPNLNDGVQISAAPLWKLFAHRPWQKKLKETWASLEAGDYDWAHLAYSIWPDRVRAKCKSDKSLAIAHDLEALYVAPPPTAKKRGRAKKLADQEGAEFGEE